MSAAGSPRPPHAPDTHPRPGSNVRTRTAAERIAEQRDRLQEVTAALSLPLDPRAVAARILDAACGALDAPQGWVAVVASSGAAIELIHAVGYRDETLEPWARVDLELETPMTEAVRTGRTITHASAAERRRAYPLIGDRGGPVSDVEASAAVPFTIEGRTIGALGVSFYETRDLDADERWYLEALAAQGAQSLERARLFAALRDRDERLRFALEASGIGIWEWSIEANRLEWSPEVLSLHGLTSREVPANLDAYLALIHPDDRERVATAIATSVRDLTPYNESFRVVRPDGTVRWTESVGRVFADDTERQARMLGTVVDITDRKVAELDRDRLIEAEREAARLRDAFIGVVSHELRTPITTIFGGTRVLARRWREMEPEARDDILQDVVEDADRLYRLVEDLLVLTRIERGSLEIGDEPIHLGRLVERVVASEQPRWPEISFQTEVPPDLPSIEGEDTYAEQVLRNLLGNAAKYGGPGSTVTVTAEASETDVIMRVLDEGPGIDEGEAERLFELFYRSPVVEGKVAGAGIGLFVCRQLVHAMGGRIHAERRSGGGAAFVVTLPRYDEDDLL
jgi:PAS domain S-box-containing protein